MVRKSKKILTLTAGFMFTTVSVLALTSCGSGGSFLSDEKHAEDIRPVTQIELAAATPEQERTETSTETANVTEQGDDDSLPAARDLREDDLAEPDLAVADDIEQPEKTVAETAKTEKKADSDYPSLASIPEKPEKTPRDRAEELKQALMADREAATRKAETATRISVEESDIEMPAIEAEPVEASLLAVADDIGTETATQTEAALDDVAQASKKAMETVAATSAETSGEKPRTLTDFAEATEGETAHRIAALAVPKWTKTPVQAQAEDLFRRLDTEQKGARAMDPFGSSMRAGSGEDSDIFDDILAEAAAIERAAGKALAEQDGRRGENLAVPRGAGINARSLYRVTRTEDDAIGGTVTDSILPADREPARPVSLNWLDQPVSAQNIPMRDMEPLPERIGTATPPPPPPAFYDDRQGGVPSSFVAQRIDADLTRTMATDFVERATSPVSDASNQQVFRPSGMAEGEPVFVWQQGPSAENPRNLSRATIYEAPPAAPTGGQHYQQPVAMQPAMAQAAQPQPVRSDLVTYRQVAPPPAPPIQQATMRADDGMMRAHDLTQDYDSRYADLPAFRRPVRRTIAAGDIVPSELSDAERQQAARNVRKTAEELARMTLNINRMNKGAAADAPSWQNPDVRTFD